MNSKQSFLPAHSIQVAPTSEITTTRDFSFSLSRLYLAWSDPRLLEKWWGPNGFTNTFHVFDLQPGGKWSFIMHGPNGSNYPNECVFLEVEPLQRLVWNHFPEPEFQVEVLFKALSESQSQVVFKMKFLSKERCRQLRAFISEKNEENMDKLQKVMSEMP